ncbi:MAG: hypothetical protein QM594_12855 [Niabella sp.]
MGDEAVKANEALKDDAEAWVAVAHACTCNVSDTFYDDDILLYDAFPVFCAYTFYNALYEAAMASFAKTHRLQSK